MPHLTLTIDGRDYDYDAPKDVSTDALTQVSEQIRQSGEHQSFLAQAQKKSDAKARNQQYMQNIAGDLGVPLKQGTTRQGKSGLVTDLPDDISINDYQAAVSNLTKDTPYNRLHGTAATPDPYSQPGFNIANIGQIAADPERVRQENERYQLLAPSIREDRRANQGTLLDAIQPYSEQTIQDTPGWRGALASIAGEFVNHPELLGAGADAGIGKVLMAYGAANIGQNALDTNLLHTDPEKYYASLVGNAALIAGPHLAGKIGEGVPSHAFEYGDGTTGSHVNLSEPNAHYAQSIGATHVIDTAEGPRYLQQTQHGLFDDVLSPGDKYYKQPGADLAFTRDDNPVPQSKTGYRLSEINQNQSSPYPERNVGITPPPIEDAQELNFRQKVAQIKDNVRNTLSESFSGLKREASPVYDEVTKYVSSPFRAAQFTSDNVPKVLSPLSTEDAQRFQTYGVADTIDAYGKRVGNYKERNLAYQPDGGRLLDPVTDKPITKADLDAYYAKPEVQQAIEAHKQLIEPLLQNNFESGGYEALGDRGARSGAFFPKLALDENGNPYFFSGGGEKGGTLAVGDTPGSKAFKGNAADYEPDYYTAIYNRVNAGLKAANKRALVQSASGSFLR